MPMKLQQNSIPFGVGCSVFDIRCSYFPGNQAELSFFPNPAQDYFTLEYHNNGTTVSTYVLEIKDAVGRTVMIKELKGQSGEELIDIKHLQPGIYLVVLRGDNAVLSAEKLTVRR
jgi:hypothetical protein